MTRVSFQMIFLGWLLIFNDQTSSFTTAAAGRCITQKELNNRNDTYHRRYWNKLTMLKNPTLPQDTRTCARTAEETSDDEKNRSLTPWRYHLNQDVDRFPQNIRFAECLCQGCIINRQEDMSYNSVPVYAELIVLKRAPCPSDPKKHVVKKDLIKVPIACTCVVPKYSKSPMI